MKYLLILLFVSATFLPAHGQQLLHGWNKTYFCYVDIKSNNAFVYTMGRYLDKAGSAPSIISIDTLQQQADGSYTGSKSRITREENEWYLVNTTRKNRQLKLDSVIMPEVAHTQLNHAWYLGRYFAMSTQLNKTFPLHHHSFREGFSSWEALPAATKVMDHEQFPAWADSRLKAISDSISGVQDKYTRVTDYLIKNIREIDYAALKDSFALLPAVYAGESEYYSKVLNTMLVSKPVYFLQLAEDFPQHKDLIFFSAVSNKQARSSMENVTGHDDTKKAFLKAVKNDKRFTYTSIGLATLSAGVLAACLAALIK
ncbi:MAG: hypothetical protein J7623_08460 [Chitinophaga sp.]|uniref:hypothetical protein n=1 Tax=Chitinophaga sp. TaxID=1869181 RepID=UPI001B2F7CFF|nr:hypothetical protein [Chitinophaga sp.]MBO9728654.1 hypothetical protein [Chitinophaga sp.]